MANVFFPIQQHSALCKSAINFVENVKTTSGFLASQSSRCGGLSLTTCVIFSKASLLLILASNISFFCYRHSHWRAEHAWRLMNIKRAWMEFFTLWTSRRSSKVKSDHLLNHLRISVQLKTCIETWKKLTRYPIKFTHILNKSPQAELVNSYSFCLFLLLLISS